MLEEGRNFMDKIRVNGDVLVGKDNIKEGVTNAFHNDVFQACGDKALDLDGFTLAFWQCYWEHVKSKVIGFFEEFYEARSFEKSSNATFLVLVPKKGGAKDLKDCFFRISRGLRQEDPLFPYLFILVMETLSRLLSRAKEGGFIKGFLVKGREDVRVEACPGLKINMEKSELIPVGDVPNLEEFVKVLGYKVGALPTTYLGLPLGAPYKSTSDWEGVEEQFQKRPTL
ncbi:hypothetical protein CK203_031912 [Vitis vinifera]|uniref:Reverse transcriptase domain-containing protein n=1 Tax=Vitis vinifera TaxID=29760 RepID=A0A438INI2_VITVI|nr:hypothetical protein CK203_031912 [Vitis vinifera]